MSHKADAEAYLEKAKRKIKNSPNATEYERL